MEGNIPTKNTIKLFNSNTHLCPCFHEIRQWSEAKITFKCYLLAESRIAAINSVWGCFDKQKLVKTARETKKQNKQTNIQTKGQTNIRHDKYSDTR